MKIVKKKLFGWFCLFILLFTFSCAYAEEENAVDLWLLTEVAAEYGYSDSEWLKNEDNRALLSVIVQTALMNYENDLGGYNEGAYIGYDGETHMALYPKEYSGTYWALFKIGYPTGYYGEFSTNAETCAFALIDEGFDIEKVEGIKMFAASNRYLEFLEGLIEE